jgi:squalene-hopene/tetraprenyl-beta-curcumene cyclase
MAPGSAPQGQSPAHQELKKPYIKDLPRATPDEALLDAYSEKKAEHFLDDTSLKWARLNGCGTCHTTIPYLMARPLIGGPNDRGPWAEVREAVSEFASGRIEHHEEDAAFIAGTTVAALSVGDQASGRALQPDTRALFSYLWKSQTPEGNWIVPQKGMLPFLERDPGYVAFMVALGIGYAPSRHPTDPAAKAGLTKLRAFIRSNLPSDAHGKAVLLWASVRTPGLLKAKERASYVDSILSLQQPDGGWALPSMGSWPRRDGAPNDSHVSDGYATSLAASVRDASIRRAVAWIQHNQRLSGRWYTRSLYSDRFQNYLSNMGTAYALMALSSCRAEQIL